MKRSSYDSFYSNWQFELVNHLNVILCIHHQYHSIPQKDMHEHTSKLEGVSFLHLPPKVWWLHSFRLKPTLRCSCWTRRGTRYKRHRFDDLYWILAEEIYWQFDARDYLLKATAKLTVEWRVFKGDENFVLFLSGEGTKGVWQSRQGNFLWSIQFLIGKFVNIEGLQRCAQQTMYLAFAALSFAR